VKGGRSGDLLEDLRETWMTNQSISEVDLDSKSSFGCFENLGEATVES
jgi:hypothetical protein